MKRLYFLGIGGTAMGSVALACRDMGFIVNGCDRDVYPPMSHYLTHVGIDYCPEYDPEHLLKFNPDAIVVGNAISRGNPTLEIALNCNIPLLSLPELLRCYFLQKRHRIVVSGTHGKTTTTNLIAYLLDMADIQPGYLIGGVSTQLPTSCRPASMGGYFVIEGDEYDSAFFDKRSKFLHYMPQTLIVTSIEYDHADIFPSYEDILHSFRQLLRLIPREGYILACSDDDGAMEVAQYANGYCVDTYGFNTTSTWRAEIIYSDIRGTRFDLLKNSVSIGTFTTHLIGEHNIRNITAALATAIYCGIKVEQLKTAIANFRPPKRRFEILGTWQGAAIIDDFAHHPTAVHATLQTARTHFPHSRIVACFEPRSNTSARNIFLHKFADALSHAHTVILCPVYRADHYPPEERLDRESLTALLSQRGVTVHRIPDQTSWGELLFELLRSTTQEGDVIVLMSNGNIGGVRDMLMSSITTAGQMRQQEG